MDFGNPVRVHACEESGCTPHHPWGHFEREQVLYAHDGREARDNFVFPSFPRLLWQFCLLSFAPNGRRPLPA